MSSYGLGNCGFESCRAYFHLITKLLKKYAKIHSSPFGSSFIFYDEYGGMVDAKPSKGLGFTAVWVQIPLFVMKHFNFEIEFHLNYVIIQRSMAAALLIISGVMMWTAGLADWIVAYATGVAQLGIWLTLFSLLPITTLWVSLKRLPFTEIPSNTAHAHWSLQFKISFFEFLKTPFFSNLNFHWQ